MAGGGRKAREARLLKREGGGWATMSAHYFKLVSYFLQESEREALFRWAALQVKDTMQHIADSDPERLDMFKGLVGNLRIPPEKAPATP